MKNKTKIIINGSGGVGKDTFVDYCRIFANVTNISAVDKIKEAAQLLGWSGGKNEDDRKFLSDMKLLSTGYNNFPYEYLKENIDKFMEDKSSNVLFMHIREPEEIDKIKKEFGCITVLVQNINKRRIDSNMADANVCNYEYDYVINNDHDLNRLKEKAIHFICELID